MAPRGFELSLIVARRDRTSAKVFLVLQRWTPSAHRQPTVSPLHTYSHVSHLPLLNILPSVSLFCPSHPVCEIIINPLVMAPRSRKSAHGRFFFFLAAHVLGSASWLNRAGVRNLFHFKQDPLIAEAPSQITSIQSSESRLIGTHELEKACFSLACQIFFSKATAQFY